MSARSVHPLIAMVLIATLALASPMPARAVRIGDLTVRAGEVPRRLVGYGLVVGLDGTGDRSFGQVSAATPTVRSVVNVLRRFGVEVPPDRLRLRNVAAVLVTAEVSPFLRAGGRFEVQVSALGDATSLRGGVLWIVPLVTDPDQPPVATAQGSLYVDGAEVSHSTYSTARVNSGRIPQGGVVEVDPPAVTAPLPRLLLRSPDLVTASRIADVVNAAFGAGSARADDPGAVTLHPDSTRAHDMGQYFAVVDTLEVVPSEPSRIIISAREGTLVAGGDLRVGTAVVSHRGITLQVGGASAPTDSSRVSGLVRVGREASALDVAAGLHAAGARPEEIAAIFEALQAAGALRAQVVIR